MPDAYFIPRYSTQEGFLQPGSATVDHQTFHWNPFDNDGFNVGRYFVTRFVDVDLPVGATISAASVIYTINAKNPGTAQTINYNHYYESTASNNNVIRADTPPLRENVSEHSSVNRTWSQHVTNAVYNWPSSPSGTYNAMSVDVTAPLQQAWTTHGGRHMALTFMMEGLAESDDLAIGNTASKRPVQLKITYSGGTAANEVAIFNDNPNFVRGTITGDSGAVRPNMYFTNSFFGVFDSNPTFQVMASDGAISAPHGGNICKITSVEAKNTAIFTDIIPSGSNVYGPTRQVVTPGEWLTVSAYVYIPSGSTIERVGTWISPQIQDRTFTATQGSWQRIRGSYQHMSDVAYWTGFATSNSAPTTGQVWYIANVNITRSRELYPYFDGATTDTATYHRTFEWAGSSQGRSSGGISYVTLDNKPGVTGSANQPPASTYGKFQVWWNYSDPYSEAQTRYRAEVRRKNA